MPSFWRDFIVKGCLFRQTLTLHPLKLSYKCYSSVCQYGVSVQFSCSVVCESLWPHGLQHARLPCPSPTCPLSRWRHPTISSSVVPFSRLQSFPASASFPMSQFFVSGGQSTGTSASASVLVMNIQGWFPLGLTGLISLQSKRHSRVFSSTTVQKHEFLSAQPSL